MKALVSGFYIGGRVGRQLAQVKELSDSDIVWSFPTFTLSLVDNPAPLLLYDEVLIDDRVAPLTIDYLLNQSPMQSTEAEARVGLLEELFSTRIFKTVRFESMLDERDIDVIRQNSQNILRSRSDWFRGEVEELKLIYGPYYAVPDPLRFEAMNTELLWQISEKLSETSPDIAILDDCARGSLYRRKVNDVVEESIRRRVARQFFMNLPTYVVGLPEVRFEDAEAFLELHQSRDMERFRQIVTEISSERDEHRRNQEIQRELYQANDQALLSLTDDFSRVNLFGLVLGVGTAIAALSQQSNWLSALGFATATFSLLPELRRARERLSRRQKWNWFVRLKSFAEKQAGFDQTPENPWPLSEL